MSMDHKPANKALISTTLSNLIVFSDLDGTLLDHGTYSYDPASEALDLLKKHDIPLVLASSKTAAEIKPLLIEIGFDHCPAIVENGAGVLWPGIGLTNQNDGYQEICQILNGLPVHLRSQMNGFSNWSSTEVSSHTGLSPAQAEQAKCRQFSEPFEWTGDEEGWSDLLAALHEKKLVVQKGGRFFSASFGETKAKQMSRIRAHFQKKDARPFMIALGDGENDIAMLESADIGVIIPNPSHGGIGPLEGEASGKIIRAGLPGPEGWNQTIMKLINQKGK